ncbi:hypothetical protein [Rhodococcus sp. NPDC058521]|uniref:hypothetical protein n=1 Tax=Rhodococcus sp. NPDC058521 TaxID=3346536 RepID=UPI003668AF98
MSIESFLLVTTLVVVELVRRALRAGFRPHRGWAKVLGPVPTTRGSVELRPPRRLRDRWSAVRGDSYPYRVYLDGRMRGTVRLLLDRGTDTAHVVFGDRFPRSDVDVVRAVVVMAMERLTSSEPWVRRTSTAVLAEDHPVRAALVSLNFAHEGMTPGHVDDEFGMRRELWAHVRSTSHGSVRHDHPMSNSPTR